ncbi:MAG: menaquinol-cytochrome reductase, partial [Pelosinus sp.]|nr:menaquinol-cytochrome reductase [Pelosinus sp.]
TRVDYTYEQVDAWYKSDVTETAWVYKDEQDNIVALSPVCKHLGCTVAFATDEAHPDQFFCPCHNGRYTKDGTNVKGTPPMAPLDVYPFQEKDGYLYLGKAEPRKEA